MRVALSGAGLRAAHVLSLMAEELPGYELVGYVDPQPGYLDRLGPDTPAFDTVEDMLARTSPDLFVVASPNRFHLDHITAGLAAGVRIFAEKPVVTSIAETMELGKLLAEHGPGRVMVGLVLRYAQHMVDLRAALPRMGPIVSLEASEHIGPYHGAFFMRDWRRETGHSGGFMLEKCCHDLDIYNMVTGSRPARVASFGGRRTFIPEHRPRSNAEAEIMHVKGSIWESTDDPFSGAGDIVDYQTAILEYESGASLAFHTNLNAPDEHRRFCIFGTYAMAEGDFVRGGLKVTARDGTVIAEHDYTRIDAARRGAHYGADHLMVEHIARFLIGEEASLPVGVVDALEAGIAALALDQARLTGQVVDLAETWAQFDAFGLRG